MHRLESASDCTSNCQLKQRKRFSKILFFLGASVKLCMQNFQTAKYQPLAIRKNIAQKIVSENDKKRFKIMRKYKQIHKKIIFD